MVGDHTGIVSVVCFLVKKGKFRIFEFRSGFLAQVWIFEFRSGFFDLRSGFVISGLDFWLQVWIFDLR